MPIRTTTFLFLLVVLTAASVILSTSVAADSAVTLPIVQSPLDTAASKDTPGQWLHVIKSPDPVYVTRGGEAKFTIVVLNTSENFAMRDVVVKDALVDDCSLAIGGLAAGGEYSFTCAQPNVQGAYTNLVQVIGVNATNGKEDSATDTAEVELADLSIVVTAQPSSLPEPGGPVTFTLDIRNTGSVNSQLDSITSPIFGDLTSSSNPLVSDNTCATATPLPELVPAGEPLTCSFSATVTAPPGPFKAAFNVGAVAGGSFTFQGRGEASLLVTDTPSVLEATLTTNKDRVALGSSVEFDVSLLNASLVDAVTIVNMSDSELGDVTENGTCTVPLELSPGERFDCSYKQIVSGLIDSTSMFTFTASGVNDDDPPQTVSAQASQDIFIFQPIAFLPFASLPLNETCQTAKLLETNRTYSFTPSFRDAWYAFDLTATADVSVLITNYVPKLGQMVVYSEVGPSCGQLVIEGNDGGFIQIKRVDLPQAAPNRYFVRVYTDGQLNDSEPYLLTIETQ